MATKLEPEDLYDAMEGVHRQGRQEVPSSLRATRGSSAERRSVLKFRSLSALSRRAELSLCP